RINMAPIMMNIILLLPPATGAAGVAVSDIALVPVLSVAIYDMTQQEQGACHAPSLTLNHMI
ncbi:MAG: hypothetical protein AB7U99_11905, partial [Steroidobacteraceae bacterium]